MTDEIMAGLLADDRPRFWAWPFGQAEPPVTPAHVHLGARCAWFGTVAACDDRACDPQRDAVALAASLLEVHA